MVAVTVISAKSSHNRSVIEYVGWIVLALIAAAGVLVTAAVVSNDREHAGRGLSGFLADVRAGLQDLMGRSGSADATIADSDSRRSYRDRESVSDLGMDAFFLASEHAGEGYMQADEITAPLDRARTAIRTRVPSAHVREMRRPSGVSGHVPVGQKNPALTPVQQTPQN